MTLSNDHLGSFASVSLPDTYGEGCVRAFPLHLDAECMGAPTQPEVTLTWNRFF